MHELHQRVVNGVDGVLSSYGVLVTIVIHIPRTAAFRIVLTGIVDDFLPTPVSIMSVI
jgi:hypothetical protein